MEPNILPVGDAAWAAILVTEKPFPVVGDCRDCPHRARVRPPGA